LDGCVLSVPSSFPHFTQSVPIATRVSLMKKILSLLSILTLSGCALTPMMGAVESKAASGFDTALEGAETWMCRGASVGSVMRKFGTDPLRWNSYMYLCGYLQPRPLQSPVPDSEGLEGERMS
jgi:hypothetical protein